MTDQVGRSPAHLDRDFFKASIDRTERETGFFGRLIEKDYYCSLILAHLFERDGANAFVFKGGTALNKVHFGFYRLSEDLDFSIAIPLDATRGDRRKARAPFEERLAALPKTFPAFSFSKAWKGANNSTQYTAEVSYTSVLGGETGTVVIDVGLREPLLLKSERRDAQCLLRSPFTGQPVFSAVQVLTLSSPEAMAEKVRAALARLRPAIRDVFDLWFAHQKGLLPLSDPDFVGLIRKKLAVKGAGPASASGERREDCRRQVKTELLPVLRPVDFEQFDFDEAWKLVEELACKVL